MEASKSAKAAEQVAQDAFYKSREAAAAGAFRLLTAGDDPLAEAVRNALMDIGFSVRDMDKEWPSNDRLEDFRVSPPEDPAWIALVEVKGYLRSRGKAEDLMSLSGRFARRFRDTEKREPSAYWYVVNHEMGTDPDARKELFDGSEGELRAFANEGGLAIDTRHLFALWRDVKLEKITTEDARRLLLGATGRFTYEPVSSATSETP